MVTVDEASAAQQRPPRGALYDTSRYLPHTDNECAGAADCQVVASPWRVVRAGRVLGIAVDCPAGKPHVQGWDTRQHEHLQAHLTGYTARGLTVAVRNAADERGFIRVFVGCSARRSPGNSVMESRVGVPTKVALPRHRGRRDSERAEGVGQ